MLSSQIEPGASIFYSDNSDSEAEEEPMSPVWGGCYESFADVAGGGRSTKCPPLDLPASAEPPSECSISLDGSTVCSGPPALAIVAEFVADAGKQLGGERSATPTGKQSMTPTGKQSATTLGNTASNPEAVIEAAKSITGCQTEECAIRSISKEMPEHARVLAETIKSNFRADGPEDSCAWLTNKNIDDVIKQLCRKWPSLFHMEFHMINFDRGDPKPLARLDMCRDAIGQSKNMFCVVINADTYGSPGTHWFCLFGDFRAGGTQTQPYTLEYFNSSGSPPARSVSEWMIKTKYNIEESCNAHVQLLPKAKVRTIQHQRDTDSECGVYCLYYIYNRVAGKIGPIPDQRITDAEMVVFRRKLFKNRATPRSD